MRNLNFVHLAINRFSPCWVLVNFCRPCISLVIVSPFGIRFFSFLNCLSVKMTGATQTIEMTRRVCKDKNDRKDKWTAGQGQNGEEVPHLVIFLRKVLLPVLIKKNRKHSKKNPIWVLLVLLVAPPALVANLVKKKIDI